jgi:phosphoethanolamine N-methyltransferase
MTTQSSNYYENFQDFLDDVQYSKQGVKKYEWIFGEGYLSTGGLETTREIMPLLGLKKGQRVLDVGCGLGGHDFFMAQNYGVYIDAIDLSKNMMSVALQHFSKKPEIADNIKFRICDVTTTPFPDNYYDVIYSRDALLHIKEKPQLFQKFFRWLKPGGRVVFTDYCRGEMNSFSDEFEKYVKQRDYTLYKVSEYQTLIKNTGFVDIKAEDINDKFVDSLHRELKKLYSGRKEFMEAFNQEDYNDLEQGWLAKVKRAKDGYQTWGLFRAYKPIH